MSALIPYAVSGAGSLALREAIRAVAPMLTTQGTSFIWWMVRTYGPQVLGQAIAEAKKLYSKSGQQRKRTYGEAMTVPAIQGSRASSNGRQRTTGYYGRFNNGPNSEWKFLDTLKALTTVASSGTILSNSLNLVDEGTGQSEMLGYKMTVRSIALNGYIRLDGESSKPTNSLSPLISKTDHRSGDSNSNCGSVFVNTTICGRSIRLFLKLYLLS